MKHYTAIVLICTLLLSIYSVEAQDYRIRSIKTSDGLSQSDARCIMQDSRGYVWAATNGGLNRYNGVEFELVDIDKERKAQPPIYTNIGEDAQGRLWVRATNEIIIYDPRTEKSIMLSSVFEFDNAHSSWVKFSEWGDAWLYNRRYIHQISFEDGQYRLKSTIDATARVHDIIIINDREFIVACVNGIIHIDKDENIQELSDIAAKSLFKRGDYYYALTSDGIYMAGADLIFEKIYDGNFDSIDENGGQFWIYNNQGLYRAPNLGGMMLSNGLHRLPLAKDITALDIDRNGQIWYGVLNGGLRLFNPRGSIFRKYEHKDNKYNNKVRSICEDSDGNLWIGSLSSGIALVIDNNYNDLHTFNLDIDKNSSYICSVGRDIYVAGDKLIRVRWNRDKSNPQIAQKEIELPSPDISLMVIQPDPDKKSIWLGSFNNGLMRYDIESGKIRWVDIALKKRTGQPLIIRNIVFDKLGNMWVATSGGVAIVKRESIDNWDFSDIRILKNSGAEGDLGYDYVMPILFDSHDNVWIGSYGGGLYYSQLDSDNMPIFFKSLNRDNELEGRLIKSLEEDENGHLWISTNRGLNRLDVINNDICSYGIQDGLQDYEFGDLASCVRASGEIVFGGIDGFNAFFSRDIKLDYNAPQLAFEQLLVNNQEVVIGEKIGGNTILNQDIDYTDKIDLNYRQNNISLSFVALHYMSPLKNKYKYKLEGFEREWIEVPVGSREARYTNLSPGKYTFKASVANQDNIWSKPREIDIYIRAPFWATPFAWVIYVLMLIAGMWVFYRYGKTKERHNAEMRMAEREKMQIKEMSENQRTFFTNLSHEFRTPLTLIASPTAELRKSNHLDIRSQKLINIINSNTNILLRLITQLLDFTKYDQGKLEVNPQRRDIVRFLKHQEIQFSDITRVNRQHLSTRIEIDSFIFESDYSLLEQIIYNLISNSIKHTPEGGDIILALKVDESNLTISVEDSGSGIDPAVIPHLFERFVKGRDKTGGTGIGLHFTRSLTELLSGVISFDTSSNGTKFFVSFPLKECDGENNLVVDDYNNDYKSDDCKESVIFDTEILAHDEAQTLDSNRLTMLIVEDNPAMQGYLSEHFMKRYTVYRADNGLDGLEMCRELIPDIIISDVMMPKLNGEDMCRMIKEDRETSHIPVLLLTAKGLSEDYVSGYASGADVYCTKPFDIDMLDAAIGSLLKNRQVVQDRFKSSLDMKVCNITANNPDEQIINKCIEYIENNIDNSEMTVIEIAEAVGLSRYLLNKKLRSLLGVSGNEFVRNIRLKFAARLLLNSELNISEITYMSGFCSLKYFRSCFNEMFGVSPSEYRTNGLS